jgi:S1-C subfamily serine protease
VKGNPGTGKTTIAKLLGEIYRELGILPIGSVTKVTRADLVAGYLGQSALKTRREIQRAIGGVLFIDEAHSLYNGEGDAYGKEAISTIVDAMTDRMGEFAIIVAGYPAEIEKFIASDPGLNSRFMTQIEIKDYSAKVLAEIFTKDILSGGLSISSDIQDDLEGFFERYYRDTPGKKWANARTALNLSATVQRSCKNQNETMILKKHIPAEYLQYFESADAVSALPKTISSDIFRFLKADVFCDSGKFDIKKTEQAVPFIRTDNKQTGSGFIISPYGHLITCDHVIKGAKEIFAIVRTLRNGEKQEREYKCAVVNTLETLDMALLKIDAENLPYLDIEDSQRYGYSKGDEICLLGYPFGERTSDDCSYRKGIISSTRVEAGFECINIDMQAESGFSGGPVIDANTGRIVGVFNGSILGGDSRLTEQINWFRPIKYFWKEFVK